MFCPVCQSEYEQGITVCPDDNSGLVDKLTAENTVHDGSEVGYRVLHTVNSGVEAEMVNDLLIQNGVRSFIRSGGADGLLPLLTSAMQGAAILVDERDYEQAQEVYSALFGDDSTPLTGSIDEEDGDTDEEDD